ncbi:MAG: hypothetical protein WDO74_17115 [Pseudomonadota bacterium]
MLSVDRILDVHTPIAVALFNVVVPITAATDVEPASRLVQQVLVRSAADLLPLDLGGVVLHHSEQLRRRVVQLNALAAHVIKELTPGVEQILDPQRRAVHVAAQARLVSGHEYVERVGLGRVEHANELGALLELRAAHGIFDVDVLRGARPTLGRDEPLGFV